MCSRANNFHGRVPHFLEKGFGCGERALKDYAPMPACDLTILKAS